MATTNIPMPTMVMIIPCNRVWMAARSVTTEIAGRLIIRAAEPGIPARTYRLHLQAQNMPLPAGSWFGSSQGARTTYLVRLDYAPRPGGPALDALLMEGTQVTQYARRVAVNTNGQVKIIFNGVRFKGWRSDDGNTITGQFIIFKRDPRTDFTRSPIERLPFVLRRDIY